MKHAFGFPLVLLVLSSCIFEQPEKNFVSVPKNVDPTFKNAAYFSYNGSLFTPLIDTLWVYDRAQFQLRDGVIFDFQLSLDDQIIREFSGSAEEFVFDAENLPSGSHTLVITQRARSGTGSLADEAGVEYAEYISEYVVVVGASLYEPKITSIENLNGSVRITWPKLRSGNFEGFVIHKFAGSNQMPSRSFTIMNSAINEFYDTTYVGGIIRYKLSVLQGGKTAVSDPKEFEISYNPKLTLSAVSVGQLKLSWKNPPFHNNIDHYELRSNNASVLINGNISGTANSVEFAGKTAYGYSNSYSLLAVSKTPDGTRKEGDVNSFSETLAHGERLPRFRKIRFNKTDNSFFLAYEPTAVTGVLGYYKIDENFNTLDSITYPYDIYESTTPVNFYMSPNGQHFYVLKRNEIQKKDVNNLAETAVYPISSFGIPAGSFDVFYGNEYFGVSNNNMLLIRHGSGSITNAYIINMQTLQKIFTLPNVAATHLSSDGKYFINGNVIYKFNGTTYINEQTLPYSGVKYVQFIDDQPAKVLLLTSNKVIIYDCNLRVQASAWDYSTNSEPYPHLDQASKVLQYTGALAHMVMNLSSGEIRTLASFDSGGSLFIEGGILFQDMAFGVRNY